VSYLAQWQLQAHSIFNGRTQAASTEQSEYFKDDPDPAKVAVAHAVLRADLEIMACFTRLDAAGAGIADKVDNGDGTISQDKCTDGDLLSLTQANWPVVAQLYFDATGKPLP
jgi:hypothetical protein